MGNYPYLVNIAWDVINKFIKDWQCNPCFWVYEREFQTEIANRLRFAYNVIGEGSIDIDYKNKYPPPFGGRQLWSRVQCEPHVWYKYNDKKERCHPDIVVWDELPIPESPPDAKEDQNNPILLVCEIKLEGNKENDWDVDKMRYLIDQGDAKHACWLNFCPKPAESGDGIVWDKDKEDKVWKCTAKLPPEKNRDTEK